MKIQELIGGVFGEMTVMMQYLFQGWNCRGSAKYRDMLLDTGTEEIGHIEILATTIAHLYHVRLNTCHYVRAAFPQGSNRIIQVIASFHFVALAMTYNK